MPTWRYSFYTILKHKVVPPHGGAARPRHDAVANAATAVNGEPVVQQHTVMTRPPTKELPGGVELVPVSPPAFHRPHSAGGDGAAAAAPGGACGASEHGGVVWPPSTFLSSLDVHWSGGDWCTAVLCPHL
ncbi:hypothetical protein CYMTET_25209 [Cymbomonas tetramitiformis]|uniref:Uncharacterized protein n=1 Tax=Cymbomonas tetramitiformis TaxID=36881 RepID=A0AAE0FV13_9CHLO|nr:hypothetical protein CYMTET_25209 [Cymbomonas tetramitiformis]